MANKFKDKDLPEILRNIVRNPEVIPFINIKVMLSSLADYIDELEGLVNKEEEEKPLPIYEMDNYS